MAKTPPPTAAGAPLAIFTVAGAIVGAILGQPTIGVIAGIAAGTLLAIALWLRERRRIGR